MKRTRLRSGLITGALLILAAIAFLYLAPTQIGGSTSYVITHGDSMEPRFHAGDLALVRPVDDYRVGQIVAYRSTVLRVVVLHRIVGRKGDRFIFKGDHNTFLDPTRPTKAQLIGALWVRVPHGGRVLAVLHLPLIAAILTGGCAILLFIGTGKKRRRRARRPAAANAASRPGASSVATHNHDAAAISDRGVLLACGVGIVVAIIVALAVGVVAFTRPLHKATTGKIPYSQQIRFGYRATAPAGLVYPSGVIRTGDPVFLRLVRQVDIRTTYTFSAAAPHSVRGTEAVFVRLSGPAGWTRTIQVAPPRRFVGDRTTRTVTLDLQDLLALLARTQSLMGVGASGAYTLAIVPRVHIAGTMAGHALSASFGPSLPFQLSPQQFQLGSVTSAGTVPSGLTPSTKGAVATPATASNTITIAGLSPTIAALRWGAVAAVVLAALTALLTLVVRRRRSSDPAARIQAKYRELIVPIAALSEDPAHSPIDVTNIKALAKLAESGQRLILHHHGRSTDTYLVEDAGTIYRYQTASTAPLQESDVAEDWTTPDEIPAPHEPAVEDSAPPEWDDAPEPLTPQPLMPEPVPPEPLAPELNGTPTQNGAPEQNRSSERPLSHVPPAWRALAILAGDDAPAPVPAPPEQPPAFPRKVLRPRRPR